MKTEMMIMEAFKDFIIKRLHSHFNAVEYGDELTPLSENSVLIDFPDVDNMRKDTVIYIQPDYENFEALSLHADQATLNLTITILTKGARSDVLIKRVFGYFTALCSLIHQDRSINGFVDRAEVTDMDYYPAVTASKTVVGIETTLRLIWDRTF